MMYYCTESEIPLNHLRSGASGDGYVDCGFYILLPQFRDEISTCNDRQNKLNPLAYFDHAIGTTS